MRVFCLTLCLLMSGLAGPARAESPEQIKARQEQARKQRTELQSAIRTLHKRIESTEASRKVVATELQTSETAISDAGRRLAQLDEQQNQLEQDIAKLRGRVGEQKQMLATRQDELSRQLHAQYAHGLSPWAALLSGDDPQAISRELGYLSYVSQAQADAIRAVRQALDELADTENRLQTRQREQAKVLDEVAQQKRELEKQHAEREKVLIRIGAQLRKQRGESDALKRDEQRLGQLVQGLEATLARQAEEARQAELARQAAERQRQEQAREQQARQEQARQEQARQEQARQEQARQAEADRARAELAARMDGEQVERIRIGPPAVPEAARAPEPARAPASARPQAPASAAANGLSKGLAFPVKGEVQGRFGAERPDGGVWRGIVLRAPEGAQVRAIAPGKVVYANWLKGFGNMLIIDHGQQYMSIYAYNQSLLGAVGDAVAAGQAIATVGATGGQVESGLYFEIRHQGAPVNPMLWLRR